MLEKILVQIVLAILEWLAGKAQKSISKEIDQAQQEKKDVQNSESYKQANDRLEKIKNAKKLLNGTN